MGIFDQLIRQELTKGKKKSDLLASPDKIAKQVSAVTERFYPFSKKPKGLTKYVSKFQGYDETAAKKGSAMAGFGTELYNEYTKNLASSDFGRFSSDEVLGETARR